MLTKTEIKALRETLAETQSEFAARFGVDQGTVSNWELGKTSPTGPAQIMMKALLPPAATATEAAA